MTFIVAGAARCSLVLVPLGILVARRIDAPAARPGRARCSGTVAGAAAPAPRTAAPPTGLAGALVVAAFVVLGVALARPQATIARAAPRGHADAHLRRLGEHGARPTSSRRRIEAAKADGPRDRRARRPPGVVIGVVAFSNAGMAVQAPTSDMPAVLAAIERLAPDRGHVAGQRHRLDARGDRGRAGRHAGRLLQQPLARADRDAARRSTRASDAVDGHRPVQRRREHRATRTRSRPRRIAADRGHPDRHHRGGLDRGRRPSTSTGSRSRPGSTRRRSPRIADMTGGHVRRARRRRPGARPSTTTSQRAARAPHARTLELTALVAALGLAAAASPASRCRSPGRGRLP